MPGSWTHLAARFFDVLAARPLNSAERFRLEGWLKPGERVMFLAQHPADQRHGFECGLDVSDARPGRPDLVRAALLHDVGKRHAGLGALGRVMASIIIRVRIPPRGRVSTYARHGELGGRELAELGVETLVSDFAQHHHQSRPATITEDDWTVLVEIDHARLPGRVVSTGYAEPYGDGRS